MAASPDERSSTGPAAAGEHYARLSNEDLKGLLQAQVLSESDAQIVSHEIERRGIYAPPHPRSRAQALGEFLLVVVVFVLVMSTIGRASPITYVLMYLSIFIPCFIAAILTSRIVPKYRSLPYSDLVVRTTRVVAVLGVFMAFGLWYGQRGAG